MAAKKKGKTPDAKTPVCVNRRARYEYEILDTVEAGLVLKGSEVKSLREGRANLVDAYVKLREDEATLLGMEIQPYSHDATGGVPSRRPRRLLMHRVEIRKLLGKTREAGLTCVPLKIYFAGPWAKVELGVVRGRRSHDKRQVLRQREAEREMDRSRRRR